MWGHIEDSSKCKNMAEEDLRAGRDKSTDASGVQRLQGGPARVGEDCHEGQL